ncbi:coiled-coil domain-containing protein 167-like [Glandiceps talaboti]
MPSIVAEIENLEDNLRRFQDRLDGVERSLRTGRLSEKQRELLLEEEEDLHKSILENEKDLKTLRAENRKSMLMSVFILAFMVGIYFAWTR